MKILFVISSLGQGGAERVLSVLANEFVKHHEVCILKFDANKPFYQISQNVKIFDTKSGVGQKGFFGNIKKRFSKIVSVRKFLKENDFDVVISFLDNTNILTILANLGLKHKIIISEHTNHTFLKSLLWKILKKITYPLASGLSVLSEFDYKHYTYVKKRAILHNPMFEISSRKMDKENIILSAGRLVDFKGFDVFLNSLSLVDKECLKEWKVVIAGDGKERENLEKQAKNLGLNIEFVGFVKDIQTYYEKSKIVAVSSKMEGFCNILMESIYFDCARISTNCVAGPSELITDGFDGYLCEVDNEKEFALKLTNLIKDENLRTKFTQNASLKKEEFIVENVVKKWLEFINLCIKDKQ